MQKLLIGLLVSVNCIAMSEAQLTPEEHEKQHIKNALKKLHSSLKEADFFAFFDLYMSIKNPDEQADIPNIHKVILENAGLLNGDQLKPLVKETFLEYAQENDCENTLLTSADLE